MVAGGSASHPRSVPSSGAKGSNASHSRLALSSGAMGGNASEPRSVLSSGAWAMSNEYVKKRTNESGCGEELPEMCIYRLDTGLVRSLASFLGNASVTELGAGTSCLRLPCTYTSSFITYTPALMACLHARHWPVRACDSRGWHGKLVLCVRRHAWHFQSVARMGARSRPEHAQRRAGDL